MANVAPPRITDTTVTAFAHCRQYLCEGYEQREVSGTKQLMEWTGLSLGSDSMFHGVVFTSTEDLQFADPTDARCEFCGGPCEISAVVRPTYQPLSGHPQDGLLRMTQGFDPGVRNTQADQQAAEAMAAANKRMAEMEQQMVALLAKVGAG